MHLYVSMPTGLNGPLEDHSYDWYFSMAFKDRTSLVDPAVLSCFDFRPSSRAFSQSVIPPLDSCQTWYTFHGQGFRAETDWGQAFTARPCFICH